MKMIKINIERFFPLILAGIIAYSFHYFRLIENHKDGEGFQRGSSISFIFATTILALLITHKSIILSTDKQRHDGLKKMLSSDGLSQRFFSYLNYPMYLSIVIILYNLLCEFKGSIYSEYIIIFLTTWLLFQIIRFLMIFNIVFEKSISKKKPNS